MDRLLEQRFLPQTVQKLGIFTFGPSIGDALIPTKNNFSSTEMLGYQSSITMAEEAPGHLLVILGELLLGHLLI